MTDNPNILAGQRLSRIKYAQDTTFYTGLSKPFDSAVILPAVAAIMQWSKKKITHSLRNIDKTVVMNNNLSQLHNFTDYSSKLMHKVLMRNKRQQIKF